MVFFSARISPFTSTVILRERSPCATAVVTSAMLRTWPVRFDAIRFTLSVRSFQVPAMPTAELSFGPHLSRDARHLGGETVELVDHRVDGFLQLEDFAFHIDRDFARKIAARDRRRDLSDVADLCSEIGRHRVHGVGEVLPGTGHARHDSLTAETIVGANLASNAGNLRSKRSE